MAIVKNGKKYSVKDGKDHWTLKRIFGGAPVKYTVSKKLCKNSEKLIKHIRNNDAF